MKMKVLIDPVAQAKIDFWIDKAVGEVSGLGNVEQLDDGTLYVNDVILLEQQNHATETEIDDAAVSKAMFDLKDAPGTLNFWWHSHVNMGVFWSGTDTDTMQQLGKNGWFLSTVFNKKGESRTAYYQKGDDFFPEVFIDDIATKASFIHTLEQETQWEKEFKDKCKPAKLPKIGNKHYGKTAYGQGFSSYHEYEHMDDYLPPIPSPANDTGTMRSPLPVLTDMTYYEYKYNVDQSYLPEEEWQDWYDLYVKYNNEPPQDIEKLEEFYCENSYAIETEGEKRWNDM